MEPQANPASLAFTAPERELLRHELCRHFGQAHSVADGLLLRTWRSGPQADQPKLPPAMQSMLARDLGEVCTERGWPRAFFTEVGSRHYAGYCGTAAPWTRCVSPTFAASAGWMP